MRNKHHSEEPDSSVRSSPPSEPEIDYSPRAYTPRQKLIFGVKLFVIIGIIGLLLWLIA